MGTSSVYADGADTREVEICTLQSSIVLANWFLVVAVTPYTLTLHTL